MKRYIIIILLLLSSIAYAEDYVDGKLFDELEVTQWDEISAPAVSPVGTGRIYFDSIANLFKVSQNGGAYGNLVGAGGGHTIQDEGGAGLTARTNLNFVGAGVTASDGGGGPDSTIITIPGGAGAPGGADTNVQYNDGGAFGGEATFAYNDITNHLGLGAAAAAEYTFYITEAPTFQVGVQAGQYISYSHNPAGALGGACNAIGYYTQAKWSSDENGAANEYVYGSKTEAIGTAAYSGAVNTLCGVFGIGRNQLSGVATTVVGVMGHVINDDIATENGNITNAYSVFASGYTDKGTGIMVNRYGLYIEDVTGGGLLTNQYGIYCPALAAGGTLNYFLYNVSAPSYFGTGLNDFGDGSLEVPNAASLTLDTVGKIGVNSTHKGFAWFDGTREVFSPSLHILQGTLDLAGWWDSGPATHEVWLMDLDAGTFPHGIYITAISVDCDHADPVTELDANLSYCDAVAGAAFPGGNVTVIKAIDTTTGNFADAAVNTAVASTKTIYIDLDADPTDALTVYHIKITYYIPES